MGIDNTRDSARMAFIGNGVAKMYGYAKIFRESYRKLKWLRYKAENVDYYGRAGVVEYEQHLFWHRDLRRMARDYGVTL